MYVLLHLALELTDLLLAQLVITRRELESSQYGPFTSDLSVDNQNRGDTRSNNSVDNSLQTESQHRANDNAPRRNADRDRFPRNRGEISNAEELLSVHGSRRYRDMARQLKLLRCFRRRTQSGNSLSVNQTSNSATTRPSDNGDDNNYDDNAQNEDNRQSTSENALSAEVQSIVERIQSSSSIDNDDRGDVRTGMENRTIDTANESRNSNESYRRSYRNATVSEPAVRRTNESRGPQETDSSTHSTENWRNYISYTSSGDEQSARPSHQRTRWARQYARGACSSILERPFHRYGNSDPNNNRRFPHSREGASLRREFNVPELQVNNVPVNDLDNLSGNPRRRQHTPPHTPPPYLINNFLHNTDNNRNNDRTNESTDQPGPSWAGQSINSRTRVCSINFGTFAFLNLDSVDYHLTNKSISNDK